MSVAASEYTAARLSRARLGVTLLFVTNGLIWSNLAPRYPEIRRGLELTYGQFGTAVMFGGIGAMVVGLSAAAIIRRYRSARVAVVTMVFMAAGLVLAALAPNGVLFAAALFAVGAIDSIVDVAQNSHGLRVQREMKRSIINSLHAMWSIGAVLGGLMGAAAAGLDIPVPTHFTIVFVLVLAINIVAYRMLLPGADPVPEATAASGGGSLRAVSVRVWLILASLAVVAIAGGWVEDAGGTWSANYLHDSLGAAASLAAMGFVALMTMQTIGRLIGDRLVDRFGQRTVARAGGLLVIVGMGSALLWPSIPLTIVGFGLAGLGVATTIPAAMHEADELPGFRAGTGLTILSWTLRLGFLLSPVLVGLIADEVSLRVGLTLVVVAGVLIVVFAQALSQRPRSRALDVETPEPHPAP
ncbi:MFS transporter [Demequina sp.]|uniref:MFS transporter n=1 Tax=Demequina sp. TaxID=2050685 RepID=UPI003D12A6ED